MVEKVYKAIDWMRGSEKEIIVRTDRYNTVKLKCNCNYDQRIEKEIEILKKVEILSEDDGTWEKYPSLTLLDGVEDKEQFLTRALAKIGNRILTINSPDKTPDTTLIQEVTNNNIYLEFINSS